MLKKNRLRAINAETKNLYKTPGCVFKKRLHFDSSPNHFADRSFPAAVNLLRKQLEQGRLLQLRDFKPGNTCRG